MKQLLLLLLSIIIKVESSFQCGSCAAMPKGDYRKYRQSSLSWSWSVTLFHFLLLSESSKKNPLLQFLALCLFILATETASDSQGFSPRGNWHCERSFGSSVKSCTWKHLRSYHREENVPGLLMWWENVKKGFPGPCFIAQKPKLWEWNVKKKGIDKRYCGGQKNRKNKPQTCGYWISILILLKTHMEVGNFTGLFLFSFFSLCVGKLK